MVWETNSRRVAVCMEDGRVWICPIDKSRAEMLPLTVPAYQLAMQLGGTLLAIATKDISPARLLYWDFTSQKLRFDIQRTTDHSVTQMAWSPDGQLLALALETGAIQLMDVEAKRGFTLVEKNWGPAHICWSDDSRMLAVVGSERSCRIWSTDGTVKQVIPNGWDASILAFSSVQPELTFWSRIGLERRSVATGDQLQRIVIWPDGKYLEIRNSGEIVRCSPEARDRIRFVVEFSGQRLETCTWQQFEELIGLPRIPRADNESQERSGNS